MTDKWLTALNNGGTHLICQGPGQCFSMSQLRRQINHLQAAITRQRCQNWVLHDNNGFQFICAMFALLSSGRDALIPTNRNKRTIESLLKPGIGLIGSQAELGKRIDIDTSMDQALENSGANADITSPGEWGKISFCTSGSSGSPKAITKSAEQLYLEAETVNLKWRPTPNTLFIPLVTHLHLYGLIFAFLLPLLARAGFYLPRNTGLLGVVEPVTPNSECPPDQLVVVASPTVGRQAHSLKVLAEPGAASNDDRPAPVSMIFCAGGKLTNSNAEKIAKMFDCPVTEIFGSTETGAVATREHNKHQPSEHNPWQLLPGLEASVVKHRATCEPGSKGELLVWGGHAGGSKENPIATGDEVRFLGHRRFELLGRNSRICKIEGKRISLNDFVETLERCELIAEAVALPFTINGKEVLLCGVRLSPQGEYCYRSSGKFATDSSIRKHLLRFLDPVLVPQNIRYLNQIPVNEMGKIPQQTLVELLVSPELPWLPLIGNARVSREELVLPLRIPMELRFFKGHFENRPIVPGVVLLRWVYHFIGEYWALSMNSAVVNRLKFSKPAAPGDYLTLTLRLIENNVEFSYLGEDKKKFSSGSIPLKAETADV